MVGTGNGTGTERERNAFQNHEKGKGKESFPDPGQGTVKKRFTIFGNVDTGVISFYVAVQDFQNMYSLSLRNNTVPTTYSIFALEAIFAVT